MNKPNEANFIKVVCGVLLSLTLIFAYVGIDTIRNRNKDIYTATNVLEMNKEYTVREISKTGEKYKYIITILVEDSENNRFLVECSSVNKKETYNRLAKFAVDDVVIKYDPDDDTKLVRQTGMKEGGK